MVKKLVFPEYLLCIIRFREIILTAAMWAKYSLNISNEKIEVEMELKSKSVWPKLVLLQYNSIWILWNILLRFWPLGVRGAVGCCNFLKTLGKNSEQFNYFKTILINDKYCRQWRKFKESYIFKQSEFAFNEVFWALSLFLIKEWSFCQISIYKRLVICGFKTLLLSTCNYWTFT